VTIRRQSRGGRGNRASAEAAINKRTRKFGT
jgi:hypothetical protein